MVLTEPRMTRISTFVIACPVPACVLAATAPAQAGDPFDPKVVLPARVDAALRRTVDAVRRSTAAIDGGDRRPTQEGRQARAPGGTAWSRPLATTVTAMTRSRRQRDR
jgi:hypothetical protein